VKPCEGLPLGEAEPKDLNLRKVITKRDMIMDEHIALTDLLTENLVYEITKALALPQTPLIRKFIASLTGNAI